MKSFFIIVVILIIFIFGVLVGFFLFYRDNKFVRDITSVDTESNINKLYDKVIYNNQVLDDVKLGGNKNIIFNKNDFRNLGVIFYKYLLGDKKVSKEYLFSFLNDDDILLNIFFKFPFGIYIYDNSKFCIIGKYIKSEQIDDYFFQQFNFVKDFYDDFFSKVYFKKKYDINYIDNVLNNRISIKGYNLLLVIYSLYYNNLLYKYKDKIKNLLKYYTDNNIISNDENKIFNFIIDDMLSFDLYCKGYKCKDINIDKINKFVDNDSSYIKFIKGLKDNNLKEFPSVHYLNNLFPDEFKYFVYNTYDIFLRKDLIIILLLSKYYSMDYIVDNYIDELSLFKIYKEIFYGRDINRYNKDKVKKFIKKQVYECRNIIINYIDKEN